EMHSELSPAASDQLAAWQRCSQDGVLVDTNDNSSDFKMYDRMDIRTLIACSDSTSAEIINDCAGVGISEIGANLDQQFIELANYTDTEVDVAGCLLQTNRSQSKQFVLEGALGPNEYLVVMVAETELILTKTTSGTVYLLSSDGSEEVDHVTYSNLKSGTSWARFSVGDWRQTYLPTPGGDNSHAPYEPCPVGQYRHPET